MDFKPEDLCKHALLLRAGLACWRDGGGSSGGRERDDATDHDMHHLRPVCALAGGPLQDIRLLGRRLRPRRGLCRYISPTRPFTLAQFSTEYFHDLASHARLSLLIPGLLWNAVAILARASEEHSRRFAVLLGSAINQDGRSSGLTAPNGPSQTSLIREVISAAEISAAPVAFVAVHGTGTPLGDPIEVSALGVALAGARGEPVRPAAMGSVKACYGHTEGAAGVTGACVLILPFSQDVIHFEAEDNQERKSHFGCPKGGRFNRSIPMQNFMCCLFQLICERMKSRISKKQKISKILRLTILGRYLYGGKGAGAEGACSRAQLPQSQQLRVGCSVGLGQAVRAGRQGAPPAGTGCRGSGSRRRHKLLWHERDQCAPAGVSAFHSLDRACCRCSVEQSQVGYSQPHNMKPSLKKLRRGNVIKDIS